MNSTKNEETVLYVKPAAIEQDHKFDLLFKRNQYLEKEYAKVMKLLNEEKERNAARSKELQAQYELQSKYTSLQNKHVKAIERLNEYHREMQQARGETIGLKRKISGIIGHIRAAVVREERPGSVQKIFRNAFESLQEENKLLKWKLSVVEGYLNGMFQEEEHEQEDTL